MTSATCVKSNIVVDRLSVCHWQVALYISLPFTEEARDNIGTEAKRKHRAKFDTIDAMMEPLPLNESKCMHRRSSKAEGSTYAMMALLHLKETRRMHIRSSKTAKMKQKKGPRRRAVLTP